MKLKFQLGNFLIRRTKLFPGLLLLLTVGAVFCLPGLKINQDYEDYLPKGDPEMEFYRGYSEEMGSEDDIIILAINNEPGIFQYEFLVKMDSFVRTLDSLNLIVNSVDLVHLTRPVRMPFGELIRIPVLNINHTDSYPEDSIRIMKDERLRNWLISADAKTFFILLFIEPGIVSRQADELISDIDRTAFALGINEMHKVGRLYWEVTYNRLANKELLRGFVLSLIILCGAIIWLYRSVRILLMALAIYLLAGILLFGYMSFIGRELNAMSNLIPIILLIVSISDLIHILEKYRAHLKLSSSRQERIRSSFNEVGLSVFLTSLTTAIGFLTLAISPVASVRNFGIDMAFGILITFFIAISLVPVFITMLKIDFIFSARRLEKTWAMICLWIYRLYRSNPIPVWTSITVLLGLSILGISRIDLNNHILSSMPSNNQLTRDVTFFDNELGGARTFEIAILAGEKGNLNNPGALSEIKKVHQYLDSLEEFGPLMSTVTLYESIHGFLSPSSNHSLPQTDQQVRAVEEILVHQEDIFNIRLIDSTRSLGRITGKMKDLGRIEVWKKNEQVERWISENTDTSLLHFKATGSMLLVDKVQQSTIRNLITGLLLAIVVISCLMSLIFKNFWMVFITVLSNILPILAVAGLMPLFNIELRYGTSIIFAIGFVIAIDDTIHLMSNYRLYKLKNYSNKASIFLTLRKTGKAILITSFILFASFITLAFSDFKDSYAVGAMISSMIVLAMLIDLIAVPVMLNSWISRNDKKRIK